MKKYKIKPYRSYYYYKQRKNRLKMATGIAIAAGVISFGVAQLDFQEVVAYFNKTSNDMSDLYEQAEPVYFQQDGVTYTKHEAPDEVKAVYLPAGYMSKLDTIIELANETEVNAVVIDIKDDKGYLTFDTDNEALQHMVKASPPIKDIEAVVDALYRHNIYPIARIVTFKDDVMDDIYPDRMIQTHTGEVYQTTKGEKWLDPYNQENWDYILDVCQEAVDLGFKEIQFDYVRFHESMTTERCALPTDKTKTDTITAFIDYAYDYLHEQGIIVSADVFGTIITSKIDAEIVGQDYKELMKHLDYICPMIYPSHYGEGSFGIPYPDLDPYGIILAALQYSNSIVKEIPREERRAEVRPWLQDFTATWVNPHQVYGAQQVREQIDATTDALVDEWILWNAAGNYSGGGLARE